MYLNYLKTIGLLPSRYLLRNAGNWYIYCTEYRVSLWTVRLTVQSTLKKSNIRTKHGSFVTHSYIIRTIYNVRSNWNVKVKEWKNKVVKKSANQLIKSYYNQNLCVNLRIKQCIFYRRIEFINLTSTSRCGPTRQEELNYTNVSTSNEINQNIW